MSFERDTVNRYCALIALINTIGGIYIRISSSFGAFYCLIPGPVDMHF